MQPSVFKALSRSICEKTQREDRDKTTLSRTAHSRPGSSFQSDDSDPALILENEKVDRDADEHEEDREEEDDREEVESEDDEEDEDDEEGEEDEEDEEDGYHKSEETSEWSDDEESETAKYSSPKEGSEPSKRRRQYAQRKAVAPDSGWVLSGAFHSGTKPDARPQPFLKHITISDDQSDGSAYKHRILSALKPRLPTSGRPDPGPELQTPTLSAARTILLDDPLDQKVKMAQHFIDHSRRYAVPDGDGQLSPLPHSTSDSVENLSGASQAKAPAIQESHLALAAFLNLPKNLNNTGEPWPSVQTHVSNMDPRSSGISGEPTVDLQGLQDYITDLQRKAKALEELERQREPSISLILYRIHRKGTITVYFDRPQWAIGEKNSRILRSNLPLSDLPYYIARHPEIAFIIYQDYDSDPGLIEHDSGIVPPVGHTQESVLPVSKDLTTAITSLLESKREFSEYVCLFKATSELPAPYLFLYHSRDVIEDLVHALPDPSQRQISLLLDYINSEYGEEYKTADSLLSMNRITLPYIKYLFKPGDILIEGNGTNIRGFVSKSWPLGSNVRNVFDSRGGSEVQSKPHHSKRRSWVIKVWSWRFDGIFRKVQSKLYPQLDANDHSEKNIADLNVQPLRHISESQAQHLKRRGETFWTCRLRNFVSYREEANRGFQNPSDERYMIDMRTYQELHPNGDTSINLTTAGPSPDDLDEKLMEMETPPPGNFIYLLPLAIKGYNLQRKKWVELQADRITEVVWSKEAFKSLVLDRKTKDLIQALISNQLAAEKSTDLISGKGNGLILLLHGGPGTGKTLTAESVAEIAEKPLYRVTCGDIGTSAEDVEKYLESVLHLGKIWGCVVLLDEADVFLEQRSLEDLRRNALVSVFLRVLEYYDGILILTSNRVGTFDEAFKSRIQLALHYANLSQFQRGKIWENFISRLESLGEEKIDFDDLKDHVEQLAENKMNGRQIRNAITTARQYAQWKGATLTYEHLKDIIEISGRFDIYLDKLNGGYTQDQLAEDEGLRLSQGP
ncbi:MAG: hypothetical protein LQ347_001757 [Umbilicaria vellea]|nr:MAG: hypothetical protein LQ347_001757 [Umbilicaria vellea]